VYIYVYVTVQYTTPFFKCLGPLLFGKPPVSPLARAFEKLSGCDSLCELRRLFGCYVPAALLAANASGDNSRERIYTLEVTFWSFLDQVQTPMGSCREAVRKIMAYRCRHSCGAKSGKKRGAKSSEMSPATAAYCTARAKILLKTIDAINAHLIERLEKNLPHGSLWHGRHVRLVDGTSVSMPDTPENQARWPQPSSQKPGCGFPLMNLVGLFCLSSGALLKAATGNHHQHESMLFQSLWGSLSKGDVLVADRGFCSFGAFASLLARGVDSLMRLPEKKIRKAIGAKLPKAESFDVIISWERPPHRPDSMSPEAYALLPQSIALRVVRYSVPHAGFRTRSVTVVTTLLDATIPAADLAQLYFRRWGIEIHFRELKTFLHMDVLRCKTPDLIERELRMHFVAYNLIRCVMQKAALSCNAELGRISFKGTLDTVRQFAAALQGAEDKPRTVAALLEEMLVAIARDLNPLRPGRSEPRAVKRRPKNYQRLTRPRHEMGNLPHRTRIIRKLPKPALN
jgi:hypothetical protein